MCFIGIQMLQVCLFHLSKILSFNLIQSWTDLFRFKGVTTETVYIFVSWVLSPDWITCNISDCLLTQFWGFRSPPTSAFRGSMSLIDAKQLFGIYIPTDFGISCLLLHTFPLNSKWVIANLYEFCFRFKVLEVFSTLKNQKCKFWVATSKQMSSKLSWKNERYIIKIKYCLCVVSFNQIVEPHLDQSTSP